MVIRAPTARPCQVAAIESGFFTDFSKVAKQAKMIAAKAMDFSFHNFRTRDGLQIDFVLNLEGKKTAIECEASDTLFSSELNPLREISRYYKKIAKVVFYRGRRELKDGDIWRLPFEQGMRSLF